ncbi:hypothetical protein MHB50_03420 [Siminovitchia sp. FSL H7-0308]|uniref:hypothetical protein n=1 Tax=unclassified Siminovitchia TaxID=2837530 RepID=UPI0030CB4B0F
MPSNQNSLNHLKELSEKMKADILNPAKGSAISQQNLDQLSKVLENNEALKHVKRILDPLQNLQEVNLEADLSEILEQTKTAVEQSVNALRASN